MCVIVCVSCLRLYPQPQLTSHPGRAVATQRPAAPNPRAPWVPLPATRGR